MRIPQLLGGLALLSALIACASAPAHADHAATTPLSVPASDVIGIKQAQLRPEFWVDRAVQPDEVLLDEAAIAAQNARLFALDDSMHVLAALPSKLDRTRVLAWVKHRSSAPDGLLFDVQGTDVPAAFIESLLTNLNLDSIPEQQATRFGMVVKRADLRTFPTTVRVFDEPGDTDIDRFQESAAFPGTPVAVVHESADGKWWFVRTPRYAAWIEKQYVATGTREEVLAYADKTPYRVITGATEHTVFTPEQPSLSQLQLDMGVRVPVLADWPANKPVNGQHPYTSWVIELPLRGDGGALSFAPALLQKNTDTAGDYLPLTRANIIRQAFKFLGERYGWGHSYNGRDCSGFIAEVYRSMGVKMPRNTSDQSVSPALNVRKFSEDDSHEERLQAALDLQIGDLVYIPGHVMMVIGHIDGQPYVIHDTTGISYVGANGEMIRVHLNAVSVTPLLPLHFNQNELYIDRMRSIVRIRHQANESTP